VGDVLDRVSKVITEKRYLVSDMSAAMSNCVSAQRGIFARALMKDPASMDKYNADFADNLTRVKQRVEEFSRLAETPEDRRTMEELRSAAEQLGRDHEEFFRLCKTGDIAAPARSCVPG
jgi:hypothetical protein